jgi:hypothetical protein
MWRIGVIGKGKIYYWKLIFWAMTKPRRLPMAVRFSIFGFHFRKILKNIYPQMKEAAAASMKTYDAAGPV